MRNGCKMGHSALPFHSPVDLEAIAFRDEWTPGKTVGGMVVKRALHLLTVSFLCMSLCACETFGESTGVEQTLMQAQHRWEDALKRFDLPAMQSLLAQDDMQIDFRGLTQDRASWLHDFGAATANVRSGSSRYEMSFDDETVRQFHYVAIVTGRLSVKGQRKGGFVNRIVRFTTVWLRRSGSWYLVNYQATPIVTP